MTFAETADRYAPKTEDIIGPYSPWPRQSQRRRGRALAIAWSIAAMGMILHFAMPIAS